MIKPDKDSDEFICSFKYKPRGRGEIEFWFTEDGPSIHGFVNMNGRTLHAEGSRHCFAELLDGALSSAGLGQKAREQIFVDVIAAWRKKFN